MILCFGILLLLGLASIGRDGRSLPFYGVLCALSGGTVSSGLLWLTTAAALLVLSIGTWRWLQQFAPHRPEREAIWPIIGAMVLLLALGLSGATLGLAATLATGVVLTGLCGAVSGPVLVQFSGFIRAACGLLVLACVLHSWFFLVASIALSVVFFVFGLVLLPRLAWRRVEGDLV
ncbi:hypothetical protein D5366_01085 [Neokomagataea tanensis]|uniref:Uncharacterized protein n=1 Tax=Neokomagataea tanensis TaxID=661191 RepID=A0A4Y6V237_9PROT|nr:MULTISPECIES: hypothetical protein [Neokomagataea]QDH24089.1 hypothetical protein D5366_01085 [Neokomagataea tanensis]